MNITRSTLGTSTVCLLVACSAPLDHGAEAGQADPWLATRAENDAGAGEPESQAERAAAESLVRVHASATSCLPESGRCEPAGVPITADFSEIFGLDELRRDTARPISETSCLYEQVLEAPADLWATFGYQAICLGRNDVHACGAHATRLCSLDLLLQWAERRSESIATRDSILGFEYVVGPQTEPARVELQRAALLEVVRLLEETTAILHEHQAGMRDCPDEDRQAIADAKDEGENRYRQLSDLLGRDAALPLPSR